MEEETLRCFFWGDAPNFQRSGRGGGADKETEKKCE